MTDPKPHRHASSEDAEHATGEPCPRCKRTGEVVVGTLKSQRGAELNWHCRECGHIWTTKERRGKSRS